jgi:hypothetical protein
VGAENMAYGVLKLVHLIGVILMGGPARQQARAERTATFTHFLDMPILFVIVSLGALKPTTWTLLVVGVVVAVAVATALTILVPRLYPWTVPDAGDVRPDQQPGRAGG